MLFLYPNACVASIEIVKRIRVMTYKLLPNESTLSTLRTSPFKHYLTLELLAVDPDSLTDATSSVITPDVIKAYGKCGGDFAEAIPFCLLRAKATFLRDANRNRECGDTGNRRGALNLLGSSC